jgi:uncharacterized protein YkwD
VYQLAAQYGVSPEAILSANSLDELGARFLDVGQELVIPEGDDVQRPAFVLRATHQVQAGESLSVIARDYGTPVESIMVANDLVDAELILAGQELIVPVAPGTMLAPTAEPVTGRVGIEEVPPESLTDAARAEAGPAEELATLAAAMLEAVNAEREAHGLPAYQADDALAGVARSHAQDMTARDYVGHTSPEGKRVRDRLRDVGVDLDRVGENYYVTTRPAEQAVAHTLSWFLDDLPHRRNILHDYYTRIGVGVAYKPTGWYIFVLDFAGD